MDEVTRLEVERGAPEGDYQEEPCQHAGRTVSLPQADHVGHQDISWPLRGLQQATGST